MTVAIAVSEDFEYFEFADDMLTYDPVTGEGLIVPRGGFAEVVAARLLDGRATLGMPLLLPLIAPVA